MKVSAQIEFTAHIIEKHGMFYAQIFDNESMNLIFDEECMTRTGAAARIGSFIAECLETEAKARETSRG